MALIERAKLRLRVCSRCRAAAHNRSYVMETLSFSAQCNADCNAQYKALCNALVVHSMQFIGFLSAALQCIVAALAIYGDSKAVKENSTYLYRTFTALD